MSNWREMVEAANRQALARLNKALPAVFPAPVLTHALERRFIPPMPRLAIDSYWRASAARRAACPYAGFPKRRTIRMDVAARQEPQERASGDVPHAARALSRAGLCTRSGLLLRLRAAGLPLRLALRSLGRGAQQKRGVAFGLRHRLAVLERAK